MKVINSEIGTYEVHSDMIIVRFNEAVDVNKNEIEFFVNLAKNNFAPDQNFAFISNKINSYSVDPLIAIEVGKQLPNLKYFANVIHNDETKDITYIVKYAFPKTVKLNSFNTLDEALGWVKEGLGS